MKTAPKLLEKWNPPESDGELADLHDTNALAKRHTPHSFEATSTPPTPDERREDQSLFRDPTMAPPIDFKSETGFKQAAKKKGKAAAKKSNAWEEPEEKKDEGDGAGDGDAGKDNTGGADAGGDGDKKDDDKKDNDKKDNDKGNGDGDAPPEEDEWASFAPAKGKKGKGKKGKVEEVAPAPAVVEKTGDFDAFDEIKLDTSPMLDLSFDTPAAETKTGGGGFGIGTWASSWTTGTTKAARSVHFLLEYFNMRFFQSISLGHHHKSRTFLYLA